LKILTLTLVVSLSIAGCRSVSVSNQVNRTPGNSQIRPAVGVIEVSAIDLFRAYQSKRSDADRTYKGKTLLVSGSVFSVQKLEMHGSNAALIHLGEGKPMVTCAVVNAADDMIDSLKKGDHLRVRGGCDGLLSVSVALHDCKIE
jgi:hypothetical protein